MKRKKPVPLTVYLPPELYKELRNRYLIGNFSRLCVYILTQFLQASDLNLQDVLTAKEAKKVLEEFFTKNKLALISSESPTETPFALSDQEEKPEPEPKPKTKVQKDQTKEKLEELKQLYSSWW